MHFAVLKFDILLIMNMTSSKPYLFRATIEWIEDNGLTPHIVVDATVSGVVVPTEHVKDGEIVLNVSSNSVKLYTSNNDEFNFSASFAGRYMDIFLPMSSIKAIFAKENQQGMFFNERVVQNQVDGNSSDTVLNPVDEIAGENFDSDSEVSDSSPSKKTTKSKKSNKKASHLKVIK